MTEATKKIKPRLTVSLLRRLLCKLGFHKWGNTYTTYNFNNSDGTPYRIAWDQYCPYCPVERENPIHVR